MGPAKVDSKATVAPMATAAKPPSERASVATAMMTNIRKKVSTTSKPKACGSLPVGRRSPHVGYVAENRQQGQPSGDRACQLSSYVERYSPPREVAAEGEGLG